MIKDADKATAEVTVAAVQTTTVYEFQLTVVDEKGQKATDFTQITVQPKASGSDIHVVLETVEVAFPGQKVTVTARVDDEESGKKLNYEWHSSDNITLETTDTPNVVHFMAPETQVSTEASVDTTVTDEEGNKGKASITVTIKASDEHYPPWVEGTKYEGGDRVSNNGVDYECLPFPYSGWCGQSAAFYKPGGGSHWQDAWKQLSSGN